MHYWSIAALSDALRNRALSPVEVTTHMLERIEARDAALKSYVTVTAERAIAQAKKAEAEIMGGNWKGPLHGVPIAYKDIIFTDFAVTTGGSRIHRDFRPGYSATVVKRLEAAGAITLGKVKTTEGAYATHHPDVEPPLNPWNAGHWSGSSSSGSGVSVAAGLAFAALGSDTGGSIRFPAAANGVTGLKPTWGRVSRYGVFELAASLDHIGPFTRSAQDAGLVLAAMAGADINDPTALSAQVPDYQADIGRPVAGLRIGVPRDYATVGIDPANAAAWEAAAKVLQSLGAILVEVEVKGWRASASSWMAICGPETALAHSTIFPERKNEYGDVLRGFIEMGLGVSAAELTAAHQTRLAFANEIAMLFDNVNLLLIPTTIWRVPSLDRWSELADGDNAEFIRFTGPFDITGSPTITIPAGFDDSGLPLTVQLVGPALSEGLLVRAGSAFQRATDWHERRPPLGA
ncbi:amidase [Rhizobium sp. Root1204]|uniref:amidase n=1 Tax=Rhizobium sp. Root1204 TaxID=1736428 RepID=UPI000715B301|nr:amidase [Rhizobium sp. Root1204]KQV41341.1 amidase [Rhizobium sp. Root1204]